VVIGARSAAEVELDTEYASTVLPDDIWPELDRD
jgi:hypothetical protein